MTLKSRFTLNEDAFKYRKTRLAYPKAPYFPQIIKGHMFISTSLNYSESTHYTP